MKIIDWTCDLPNLDEQPLVLIDDPDSEVFEVFSLKQGDDYVSGPIDATARELRFKIAISGIRRSFAIHQDPAALKKLGSTGSVVWQGAGYGVQLIRRTASLLNLHRKSVLELGSGCGLVGLTAAVIAKSVVLTDQQSMMDLLQLNAIENNVADKVETQVLNWGDDKASDDCSPHYDIILACDCIFNEHQVSALLQTLKAQAVPPLLPPPLHKPITLSQLVRAIEPATLILAIQQLRTSEVHEAFLQGALESGFLIWRIPVIPYLGPEPSPVSLYALVVRGVA